MSERLKVLIVGAGTKGALYPDERLTHAWAFSRDGFELVGFFDTNGENSHKAAQRWNTQSYATLGSGLDMHPDVVCVAASDTAHFEILKKIAEFKRHKPRLVFTEKPFCQNLKQARHIAKLYKKAGITLSVNFSRRFLPQYQQLAGTVKTPLAFTGTLTKGLHNYCHLADLAGLLGAKEFGCININRQALNVFEAEIYTWGGKISILDHGALIQITPTKPREDYPTESMLDYSRQVSLAVDLKAAMGHAANNIYQHLTAGAPLLSTVENALQVMEVCEKWRK